MSFEESLVKKTPTAVISIVIIVLLIYVGALLSVAIFQERSVSFWPPSIGEGPKHKVVSELKNIRNDLASIKLDADSELSRLNERLNIAREKSANSMNSDVITGLEWKDKANEIQLDVERYEDKFVVRLNSLEDKIKELELNLLP